MVRVRVWVGYSSYRVRSVISSYGLYSEKTTFREDNM